MTALLFVFLFGPAIIDLLRVKRGKGQPIREDGPATPAKAARRPWATSILSGITVALLWANGQRYVWIVLL
jgi:phospho-N-acetylmuramoyl-pentapeptide-transferase